MLLVLLDIGRRGTFLSLPPRPDHRVPGGPPPAQGPEADSPDGLLYEKYFHDKTSVWDGTRAQAERKVCQFLS
jgi:hypothetical protein